jgi:hypothetical protein
MITSAIGAHHLTEHPRGDNGVEPIANVPPADPNHGLVYDGLVLAKKGTPCAGAYLVDGATTCSHGPDAPPPGLDVKRPVSPVAPATQPQPVPGRDPGAAPSEVDVARDAGSVALVEAPTAVVPDATPDAAAFTVGVAGIACDGDGQAGKRVQALYVYEAGTVSRYAQFLASFRTWAAGVDAIYHASARETGGSRHVRYVTTPSCEVDVPEVELPAVSLSTFATTITALGSLGFNKTDRKYMIFAEARVYCGIGTINRDERTGANNGSNSGPSYGRTDSGCWSAGVVAHELAHNLGAVNDSAPNSSKAGHCVDEYDVMCNRDSSGKATNVVCTDRAHDRRMDCNHDDYFHTNPSPGSYLATHWNVAESEFLINSGDAESRRPTPTPSPSPRRTDAPAPTVITPGPTTPGPSPTGTLATTAGPSATGSAPAPMASSGLGTSVLRVTDVTATTARLSWDTSGPGTRYAVQLGGGTVSVVRVTAVRVAGLRPDTVYTVQISVQRPDLSLVPDTMPVRFETGPAVLPVPGSWLTLTNALTGGAAEVFGARSAGGTPVVHSRRHDGGNQRWRLEAAGTGTYRLRSASSGKCLAAGGGAVAAGGGAVAAGAPLVQQTCDGAQVSSRWRLVPTAYGFALGTVGANLVVGIGGTRYYGHRLLVLQTPSQRRYQSWTAA